MTKWTMAYRELFVLTSLVILLPTLVGALCWREFVWFPLGLLATHWLVLFFIQRRAEPTHFATDLLAVASDRAHRWRRAGAFAQRRGDVRADRDNSLPVVWTDGPCSRQHYAKSAAE